MIVEIKNLWPSLQRRPFPFFWLIHNRVMVVKPAAAIAIVLALVLLAALIIWKVGHPPLTCTDARARFQYADDQLQQIYRVNRMRDEGAKDLPQFTPEMTQVAERNAAEAQRALQVACGPQ